MCETFWIQEQIQDEDASIKKEKNCANVATKPIFALCNTMLLTPQDWYSTGDGSHTPLQYDGDKPMMDLAPSLQTWYEHTVALTCAQRPSVNTETETETDSCQY